MAYSKQVRDLQRRLEAIPAAIKEELKPSLMQSGQELADAMKHLAEPSRDTGGLIDSVALTAPGETTPAYSQPGGSRTAGELEVIVTAGNSEVRYPHLVEYGTVKAPAQPFFWPAVRSLQQRINNRTNRKIRAVIKKLWGDQ
jgi:HK97 gp10 family phage protein